jgi:hypothetical protein
MKKFTPYEVPIETYCIREIHYLIKPREDLFNHILISQEEANKYSFVTDANRSWCTSTTEKVSKLEYSKFTIEELAKYFNVTAEYRGIDLEFVKKEDRDLEYEKLIKKYPKKSFIECKITRYETIKTKEEESTFKQKYFFKHLI